MLIFIRWFVHFMCSMSATMFYWHEHREKMCHLFVFHCANTFVPVCFGMFSEFYFIAACCFFIFWFCALEFLNMLLFCYDAFSEHAFSRFSNYTQKRCCIALAQIPNSIFLMLKICAIVIFQHLPHIITCCILLILLWNLHLLSFFYSTCNGRMRHETHSYVSWKQRKNPITI